MSKLLSYPALKAVKGIPYTRQHLARMEKAGQFPKRVQIGPNRVAWLEHEVDAHVSGQPRGPLQLTPSRAPA